MFVNKVLDTLKQTKFDKKQYFNANSIKPLLRSLSLNEEQILKKHIIFNLYKSHNSLF